MSRVVFATMGSLGDLHPVIALALKMRERGHTVAICTSPFYREKIEAPGFEFHPLRPDISLETPETLEWMKEIMDPRNGAERLLQGFVFPHLRETFEDLSRAVASGGGADLLVSQEVVYAAPLVAEKTGVAWASLTLSPMSFFSAYDPPILPPAQHLSALFRKLGPGFNQLIFRLIKFYTRSWSKPVRALRAELNLPAGADPIYEGKYSPQLVLAMFSPLFAKPQPDWPPHTQAVGFPFFDGPTNHDAVRLEGFLSAGDPPIVFTLGSAAVHNPGDFFHVSAEAVLRLKRRAVLIVGKNTLSESFPPEIAVFEYLPYSHIFPRAAVIVHQGGIGTSAQGLRAGRPMLVMPYGFDQADNAARLGRLRVARKISRNSYDARGVATELSELLSKASYLQNAREISAKLKDEDGAKFGAEALERLLRK